MLGFSAKDNEIVESARIVISPAARILLLLIKMYHRQSFLQKSWIVENFEILEKLDFLENPRNQQSSL